VVSYVGQVARGSESTHLQAGVIGESSLYRYDMTYDYGHEVVWIDPLPKLPERAFNRAGVSVRKDTPDALTVAIVLPDSPATAAGIAPGDRILAINGEPATALSATDASLLFTGPVGSAVDLQIAPKTGGGPRAAQIRLKDLLP
jgi:S1-C subfamily serine protease